MAVRNVRGRYTVEFESKGHRVFRRLPLGASKAQAQELENKIRREIIDQALLGKKPDVSLAYCIRAWVERGVSKETASKAGIVLRGLEKLGEDPPINSDWTPVAGRLRKLWPGLKPATINRRVCILKAVAKFAWEEGLANSNPSAKLKLVPENNERHYYLTIPQVNSLIRKMQTPEGRAFAALSVYTGMRQGEVMKAKVTKAGLLVEKDKLGNRRLVPYVGPVEHLQALPFTKHVRTLYAEFERARGALKLPYVLHYHDLRHTAASLMINAGVDVYTVGEILGHRSTQTTKRYAHLATSRKREALEKAFPIKIRQSKKPKKPPSA